MSINLSAESVQGSSLSLQGVNNVHSSHSLSFGVLGVSDSIADDVLKENLEHTSGFFVDQTRDTFHATTTSKTANGRLGDSLDVVS